MGLRTPFTELVGCDVPIQLAPMPLVASPELIAAVDRAGAMGGFGIGPLPPEYNAVMLDQVSAQIEGPLVVNILHPFLEIANVELAAKHATVVDFYHGQPDAELVEIVHDHGALAGWQVGSLAQAEAAVQYGCDLLVVRGVEGGGRMYGTESLWPLLVEVIEAVDVPVLAAGGIGDSRGMAAALAAGAAGVRMGTRFLAAAESPIHSAYREALIAASGADSVLTDDFDNGWPDELSWSRVLRHSLDAALAFEGDQTGELALGPITIPLHPLDATPPMAASSGAIEAMAMYAGESVRFVRSVESATEIVESIAHGAERLLREGFDAL